ncbi:MAG: ribonuclease Y, partial [Bacteroidota bacterium]
MEIGIGLGIGLVVGLIVGFVIMMLRNKSVINSKLEEINTRSDQEIKEARLSAKRLIDEAETKAEKIEATADLKNEKIKQRKIQEAKEKFNRYRSDFDKYKAEQKVELKER